MQEIISKIQSGIQEVFPEVGEMAIDAETMLGQIPDWDSMAAINLQVHLEQQYNISVPTDLLSDETTIADLVALIQSPEQIDAAV
jgi:acyl carrier protein